jgi:protein-tyrosine phosphatase
VRLPRRHVGAVSRELAWEACVNVRDLGGLPTPTGPTRTNSIVRSDTVRGLSETGWGALAAHGVTSIVDLRDRREVAADRRLDEGSNWIFEADVGAPPIRPVPTHNVALLGAWNEEVGAYFDEVANAEPDGVAATRAVYLAMLDRFSMNVAAVADAVGAAPDGAVLVHCHAGKDRTGLVAALLLLVAGVDVDEVADDYALSGPNIARSHDVWVDEAPDEQEQERRRRIGLAPRQAMVDVIAEIEARWDGAEAYLALAGTRPDAIDKIRGRLVG